MEWKLERSKNDVGASWSRKSAPMEKATFSRAFVTDRFQQ
jgi:hypothetical protein